MLRAVVVFCLAATPWSLGQKVHEHMSAKQVAEVFQTTHDSVPEYQVVQFHVPRVRKRATGELEELKSTLFGNDVQLWLKPSEGDLAGRSTPVFKARKDPQTSNVIYEEIPGAMANLGRVLEDPAKKATLLARTDARGQYSFNGFIGSENLIVRSLPESISNDLVRNSSSHSSESAYHVVFKRKVKDSDTPFDHSKFAEARTVGLEPITSKILPSLPKVLYPECMVVVDHSLFKIYEYNIVKVLEYLSAFWNGVDLLYRSFDEPKFRFNIARIIVAMEETATPYLSDNMYSANQTEAESALEAAQRYFYSIRDIFPTNSYDTIAIMTNLEMTDPTGQEYLIGIADHGVACKLDHKQGRVESVTLTNDDGTFYGVTTAAHEFAHILGALHDEDYHCKQTDGYIMTSDSGKTNHIHDFSQCTITAIETFLRGNGGFCFYNEPIVRDPLPRGLLPGLVSSRDHHCEILGHGPSCHATRRWQVRCSAVYCYDKIDTGHCLLSIYDVPPDGAFCSTGKICLHGQCVKL